MGRILRILVCVREITWVRFVRLNKLFDIGDILTWR
jgi:hypothetical protein